MQLTQFKAVKPLVVTPCTEIVAPLKMCPISVVFRVTVAVVPEMVCVAVVLRLMETEGVVALEKPEKPLCENPHGLPVEVSA